MPIFISYSHTDAEFVDKLATHLIKQNTHIWVDTWELNVGDSILNKVQQAIQESSALLVVLSKSSVASEWCKKELSAGLMRELDEKCVVVLPVLLEDCDIPIFLREKMYADFRKSFDTGLNALVNAVSRVTNTNQGRIKSGTNNTDWAEDWGYEGKLFRITYTLIESSTEWPFTLLTEVVLRCNAEVTKRYENYVAAGLDWVGRLIVTEALAEIAKAKNMHLILENQFPHTFETTLKDSKSTATYDVTVKCRRMGEDTGKDQIINISTYLLQIRDYGRKLARKLTPDEHQRVTQMLAQK